MAVTAPPLERYSGVLFRALGVERWTSDQRQWADAHLVIHSAELGPVVAAERGACAVDLDDLAAHEGPLIDLRSKEYVKRVALPPGQTTVRVVRDCDDGRRLAVSHWNKHYKGVLVGALVAATPRLATVEDLITWSHGAGFRFEWSADSVLDLVV